VLNSAKFSKEISHYVPAFLFESWRKIDKETKENFALKIKSLFKK
jgi:hypothetical protein